MKSNFYKYHGAGNDFIIFDNRGDNFPKGNTEFIKKICHRNFGIGADGVLLLEHHPTLDFTMVYFNSDGEPGSMCGNGGRCMVHFAHFLGIIAVDKETVFEAFDGAHRAMIDSAGTVALRMKDVMEIEISKNHTFLNTGSPHHVEFHENVLEMNVEKEGSNLRNTLYGKEGANINFVEKQRPNSFLIRTYERGVELETMSCGTGAVAVAVAMHQLGMADDNLVVINCIGGTLKVMFEKTENGYKDIVLFGPAVQVFKGVLEW